MKRHSRPVPRTKFTWWEPREMRKRFNVAVTGYSSWHNEVINVKSGRALDQRPVLI